MKKELPKAALFRRVEKANMTADNILLHRDDPAKEPLVGHVKVTRQDWLNVARNILIAEGISQVKILTISERLNVSRSSFYWYFKSRKELLSALLKDWEETNTAVLIAHCEKPARSICHAVCNLFNCFVDRELFDHLLDFGIREWSRRNKEVRAVIDSNDAKRVEAIAKMFVRFDYPADEADIRARVLYYMQIGYYALDLSETVEERLSRVPGYLYSFTGVMPELADIQTHTIFTREKLESRKNP